MSKGNWSVVKFVMHEQRLLCLAAVEMDFDGKPLLAFEDWPEENIDYLTHPDFEFMTDEEFVRHANNWLNEQVPTAMVQ